MFFSVLALAAILFDRVEPFGRLPYEEKLSLNYLKKFGPAICGISSGSTLFVTAKILNRQQKYIFL